MLLWNVATFYVDMVDVVVVVGLDNSKKSIFRTVDHVSYVYDVSTHSSYA